MTRFENNAALVTGGPSGIGQAIAERLQQEGARVFIVSKGSIERLGRLKRSRPWSRFLALDDAYLIPVQVYTVDGERMAKLSAP